MFSDLPKPVMGILASGHPKKGHDFFLQLWKELGKPGSLIFAGKLSEELSARASAEGVHCPGFVSPGPLLRSLDLLLIPSTSEGIPTVMLEAMVRGVPVLATPVGGNAEVISHGENGFLLPRENWAEFLRHFPEKELPRVASAGQQHVLQNFSFEQMKTQFIQASQEALRRGR